MPNEAPIQDTEKAKVLQAICSVIQALPLKDAIGPVEVSLYSPLFAHRQAVTFVPGRCSSSSRFTGRIAQSCSAGKTKDLGHSSHADTGTKTPEEARTSTVAQLHALSGCAKGLTNNTDPLLEFSTADEDLESVRLMEQAREDPRMTELRNKIIQVLTLAMSIWSADAEVGDVSILSA